MFEQKAPRVKSFSQYMIYNFINCIELDIKSTKVGGKSGLRDYSRVHKSSDSFFSNILKKPSIVQKKMIPHIKGLDFSQR